MNKNALFTEEKINTKSTLDGAYASSVSRQGREHTYDSTVTSLPLRNKKL